MLSHFQVKEELDEVLAQNANLQKKVESLGLLLAENQEEIRCLRESKAQQVDGIVQRQGSEQAVREEASAPAVAEQAAPFSESRARALFPRKAESRDELSFEVDDEGAVS